MTHDWFTRFDRRACEGTHPAVDGTCPEKKTGEEGLLAMAIGGTFLGDLLNKESLDKCGACGCSLVGLDAADAPPDNCVRRDVHARDERR